MLIFVGFVTRPLPSANKMIWEVFDQWFSNFSLILLFLYFSNPYANDKHYTVTLTSKWYVIIFLENYSFQLMIFIYHKICWGGKRVITCRLRITDFDKEDLHKCHTCLLWSYYWNRSLLFQFLVYNKTVRLNALSTKH